MERERPATQEGFAGALRRRVDHLELSTQARDRILASAHPKVSPKAWHWPRLALAGAACLLIAVLGVVRLPTSKPTPPHSRIKCVSVVYADAAQTAWLKRSIIVHKVNGTESYIKIVAEKPIQGKAGRKQCCYPDYRWRQLLQGLLLRSHRQREHGNYHDKKDQWVYKITGIADPQ